MLSRIQFLAKLLLLIAIFAKQDIERTTKLFVIAKRLFAANGEQIDPACCGVAVGSPSPGCAVSPFLEKKGPWVQRTHWTSNNQETGLQAAKGTGVHRLKGDVSWVQNGVSQFGLYLLGVLLPERKEG